MILRIIMTIKINYISLIIFFLFISCASNNVLPIKIHGVYVHDEYKNIQLELNEKTFVLIDTYKRKHMPLFKCCDTITYGNWRIDKQGLLILSTKDELNTSYLNMAVDEKIDIQNKDSITFIFNNPIEKHYVKFNERFRELDYTISFYVNGKQIDKTSDANPIKIKKTGSFKEFEITITPKHNIRIRSLEMEEVYTLPYEIKETKSNVFIINIPKLNYGYLTYKRLNDDYVKIVNKNKLIWDNKVYIKNRN